MLQKHFAFPKFTTPMTGTLKEIVDNYTTINSKISLNGLGLIKGLPASVFMVLSTGMGAFFIPGKIGGIFKQETTPICIDHGRLGDLIS